MNPSSLAVQNRVDSLAFSSIKCQKQLVINDGYCFHLPNYHDQLPSFIMLQQF